MRRCIAAAVGLFVLGGVGCQSFKYVQKDATGGVVEFKASEKDGVIAKLQQEHGEIEIETIAPKGTAGGPFDPSKPVGMSERLASTSAFGPFAAKDEDKLQLKFHKKATGTGGPLPGLPPIQDDVLPAGYKTVYPTKTGGAATVGKSDTALPKPDMTGFGGLK